MRATPFRAFDFFDFFSLRQPAPLEPTVALARTRRKLGVSLVLRWEVRVQHWCLSVHGLHGWKVRPERGARTVPLGTPALEARRINLYARQRNRYGLGLLSSNCTSQAARRPQTGLSRRLPRGRPAPNPRPLTLYKHCQPLFDSWIEMRRSSKLGRSRSSQEDWVDYW
jgi:hypothetical protein